MYSLSIGDTIQNSTQRSIVRWLGEIEGIPTIGLHALDLTLPGYTDGTCSFDNNRYFECPLGQGYYILETGFNDSYTIVREDREINKTTSDDDDDEFKSPEQSLPSSPVNLPRSLYPIISASSPIVCQSRSSSENNHVVSPSRGVLSRLTSECEQRKSQVSSPTNSVDQTSFNKSDPRSSRRYQPENYKSASYDRTESQESAVHNNEDPNETNSSPPQSTITRKQPLPVRNVPLFGHEYFLDNWTLGRVKNLLEHQIPIDNQLCLNISNDQWNVEMLIDEQISRYSSLALSAPPSDVRIELIKVYEHVEVIFPSRAIRLYDNDYLLLAILCSNNNCAYIRTLNGWAYTDVEGDEGQSNVVDEISRMIDGLNDDLPFHSEQCCHVLKDASFLYYKLVE